MEATCREWVIKEVPPMPFESHGRTYTEVCGAPIPRLDEGPCRFVSEHGLCDHPAYGHPQDEMGAWVESCPMCADLGEGAKWQPPPHAYLGPLASECTAGHPVVVPTEAERS